MDEVVLGSNEGRSEGDELDPSSDEARAANNRANNSDWEKFPCTHPVASFRITKHFDIIRGYNSSTGEQSNVISENSSDRHWHERDYIRVAWTDQNVKEIDFSLFTQAALGWAQVSNTYYVQEEADDCRFEITEGKYDYSNCQEGYLPPMIEDMDQDGNADSIMVTNRMTIGPGSGGYNGLFACWWDSIYNQGTGCTNSEIGMRYSFLRVPQRPQAEKYEDYYPDRMFERFGAWRVIKDTFSRGRGQTDFKQYLGTRFQIWEETQTCDADGTCTQSPFDRTFSHSSTTSIENSTDLKKAAFEIGKEWNDAFNGIHPNVDLETSCEVKCDGGRKDYAECTNQDSD